MIKKIAEIIFLKHFACADWDRWELLPEGSWQKKQCRSGAHQILDSLAGGELGDEEIKAIIPPCHRELDGHKVVMCPNDREHRFNCDECRIELGAHAQTIRCNAQKEKRIGEIFEVGDKILEVAEHGDYSSGNDAFGVDEGRVRTYELLKELTEKWQALKAKEE